MDEQTTIVGRPTYMAAFAGAQDAGAIVDKLTSVGYPREDISVLLRPAGTDSAIDLLSGENAAGQDVNALAQQKHKDGEQPTTLVLLHPNATQLEAVRAALTGMGAKELEYEPETRYTGEDSEADFVKSTIGNVDADSGLGAFGPAHPTEANDTEGGTEPGHFNPPPNDATSDAPPQASGGGRIPVPTPEGTHAEMAAGPADAGADSGSQTGSAARTNSEAAPPATHDMPEPLPDTSDLQARVEQLKTALDDVKKDLEQRD
ncbi:MAG TPA: hypothetical protein VFM49_28400 [Chloroflexia bacterium]|jgi:hypothetical protein|nr:hypothetical protein [Chloroflexia bacterium]